jgi:hypothetical protein
MVAQSHVGSFGSEHSGHGGADPAGRTRDEDNLIPESHIHGHLQEK